MCGFVCLFVSHANAKSESNQRNSIYNGYAFPFTMQCNTIYERQIVHHSKEKTTKINVYNAMQCNAIELYS